MQLHHPQLTRTTYPSLLPAIVIGVPSLENMDSYIAFFKAGETTSELHIPVKEMLSGAKGLEILVSLSIPDVSYSLGVRASVWDKATILITGELPHVLKWDLLEDDEEDFFSRRVTRQAGEHQGATALIHT